MALYSENNAQSEQIKRTQHITKPKEMPSIIDSIDDNNFLSFSIRNWSNNHISNDQDMIDMID